MNVGVRFCGGCNPRYDRGNFYKKIAKDNPYENFEIAQEGVNYDVLLVIGGCTSCCASYTQFKYDKLVKVVHPVDNLEI